MKLSCVVFIILLIIQVFKMSEMRCKMSRQRLVWQVFTIFCCPPFPSRIAAKLAFLPPEPSYYITDESTPKITWKESSAWLYTEKEKVYFEGFYAKTSRKNRIACIFVRCCDNPKYIILYSHANAVDLGHMSSFYLGLGMSINCNIFSYDYSGYGMSTGKPSEKNIYSDIECAWNTLMSKYEVNPDRIILYGQSIGTVPTVDLASKTKPAAVVLHSALMSGLRLACPNTKRTLCCDAFPSIDKISKVTSPVLVIHGKEDEVIDFTHGKRLYKRCPNPVKPLWVDNAGHNDIEIYKVYLDRLLRFIYLELPTIEKDQTPPANETNERATESAQTNDEPSHDSSDPTHRGSSNQSDPTEPNESNKKSFQTYD